MKILLFSPVRKDHKIVSLFLDCLKNINKNNNEIDYCFYDDNVDELSSELLNKFVSETSNSFFLEKLELKDQVLADHDWSKVLYSKITEIKDEAIKYFLSNEYDYLFLIDADLCIHPDTIIHLLSLKKDFVSEIFWTHFESRKTYYPNAWYVHGKHYSKPDDILKLKNKDVYEVGATGACTLLTKKILNSGVRFEGVQNISNFLGEDKHFCTRAHVLGFTIYLDTHYPAYHIYDVKQASEAENWIKNNYSGSFFEKNWLGEIWKEQIKKDFISNFDLPFFNRLKLFLYGIYISFKKHFKFI